MPKLRISPATIDRLLEPTRVRYRGRGRTTTKPGTLLRKQIPIKTNQWDGTESTRQCAEESNIIPYAIKRNFGRNY